jgi:hypothetical protein
MKLFTFKSELFLISECKVMKDYKPYQVLSSPKTIPLKMPYFRGIPRDSGFCTHKKIVKSFYYPYINPSNGL